MNELPRSGLLETPIVFMLLDDWEGQLYNALIDWQVARSLTEEEKRKYERFIPGLLTKTETALRAAFEQLQRERTIVAPDGIVTAERDAGPDCGRCLCQSLSASHPLHV